jgi:hypothetical protein
MMLAFGTPVNTRNSPIVTTWEQAQATPVVHSIKGYLAFCQDQMPNLDIEFIISGNDNLKQEDKEKFTSLAQIWKDSPQDWRREYDTDAAKNEPHPGETGQGGYGNHPKLSPYEVEGVLTALNECPYDWNTNEELDA